ncbi:hypothetical protein H8K33_05530 [Undibacterium amnicola]|uniref:Uncharacterized protein n=1 Tax=Undibacterium amnicola TaxID=1834038 RepID=A0ABR6XN95_9BURK|nr:hypothetical protein [Undibacterium amnicola]MBC3830959.1 hypothetical protein [Undibacterium amnicola]
MIKKKGVLKSYQLGEVLKLSSRKIGERCGYSGLELLTRRLAEYIGTVEEDKYSYAWRSAIEDHEQDSHIDDYRSALVNAVRDAALGATVIDTDDSRMIVKTLLLSPYQTLIRIGIFVCGENYRTVGGSFWDYAKDGWFYEHPYWHEIYGFIKKSFAKFSATERDKFLCIIDNFRGDWTDDSRQVERDESFKRDLLYAASGLGDSELDEKYQRLVEQYGPVREHPDFHFYSNSGWVGERSPLASDELIAMSKEELIRFLSNFSPAPEDLDGPSYRGLASSLTTAVRASHDGFGESIELFVDLARPYQHGLLRGLKERWADDKQDINWDATVKAISEIVSKTEFIYELNNQNTEGWEPSVSWVVSDIAELVKSATSAERHLPIQLYDSFVEVLSRILGAQVPSPAEVSNDAVTRAINSARGRILEALIYLALAVRREELASGSLNNDSWSIFGPIFDSELSSSEQGQNVEFATLAGLYCVNLHYINSQWTESNFHRLFASSNEVAWRCSAQGFSYQRYLYDWFYKKLVEGGHLRKMLFADGLPDQVSDRAIQFLGLAYLQGMESLDNGLFAELIIELKLKELRRLCWFFWTLRSEGYSAHAPKIIAFWLRVSEQMRESNTHSPELQSALTQLVAFVQEFDSELLTALVEVAPNAQVEHHGYILIEHLARLASSYPSEVAKVFKAALLGFLPDFDRADIINCVMCLADAGAVDDAEFICNAYAHQGSILLKETYENIRAKQRATATGVGNSN